MSSPKKETETVHLLIAGFIIKVNFEKIINEISRFNLVDNFRKLYAGFIYNDKVSRIDFTIILSDSVPTLVLKQRSKNFLFYYEEIANNMVIANSQMGWIHLSILLKNILFILLKNKGFILHASASKIGEQTYLFLGESGAGKSTIVSLLNPKGQTIADDSIIIKKEGNNYFVYQTPFVEKNQIIRTSKKYPLSSVMFLIKSKECKLIPKDNNKVAKQFLKQIIIDDSKDIKLALQFLSKFNRYYSLYFSKDKKPLIQALSKIV